MKDVTGKEIKVGDIVATSQKRGSSSWLNVYPVVDVNTLTGKPTLQGKRKGKSGKEETFRIFYNRGEDTIVIVERAKPVEDFCGPVICTKTQSCSNHDPGDEQPGGRSLAW